MKKIFVRQKSGVAEVLLDETNNSAYSKESFTSFRKKKLLVKEKRTLLNDIGSGSETEYQSIQALLSNSESYSELLEKLLLTSEKGNYVSPSTFFPFLGDSRVSDALIKASETTSDEDFSSYARIFGLVGESRMLAILYERFARLKNNPKLFETDEFFNWIADSMEKVCTSILRIQPTNIEVAEFLVRLTEHPSSFNRESVVRAVTEIHRKWAVSIEIMGIFGKKLNTLWKTREDKIFIAALPFLVYDNPEKALSRLKKIYLKAESQQRDEVILWLYQLQDSPYLLGRLAREISNEENSSILSALASAMLQPILEQDLFNIIRKGLVDESPSIRASSVNRLSNLSKEKAAELAEEAIKDEPDKLIKGLLKKFVAA